MLIDMNPGTTGLEDAKLLYHYSGGNAMGWDVTPGLGSLGATQAEALAKFNALKTTAAAKLPEMATISSLINRSRYDEAWKNMTMLEAWLAKKGVAVTPAGVTGAAPRASTFPEQMQATGGFMKDLATAISTIKGKVTGEAPAPGPRPQSEGTDWTTWALVGGGVLLAGAVVFTVVKKSKKGKKR
jgi:hypothetical protein